MIRIGIDPGGIKTKGIVMDEAGRILLHEWSSTAQPDVICNRRIQGLV